MRLLVTGGLGYIGGRLSEALGAVGGYELTLGSRRPSGAPNWTRQFTVVRTDWTDERELVRICRGMDAIVQLAGMNAAACAADPVAALEFNAVGTARLLRAAQDAGVGRFVYLSTLHVYGAALEGTVDELTRPEPRHPYATSHRAAEDAVRSAHSAGRIQAVVVRLSNSFGAPADPACDCWSLAINDFSRQAVRCGAVRLRTAGRQRRDFVPLSEACRAIQHLISLSAASLGDGVFNVGGGWTPSLLEAAEAVAAEAVPLLGARPSVHPGIPIDATGAGSLDFSVQRLLASGFSPLPHARNAELRRLVEFCMQHAEQIAP